MWSRASVVSSVIGAFSLRLGLWTALTVSAVGSESFVGVPTLLTVVQVLSPLWAFAVLRLVTEFGGVLCRA
jgi:hypothetical protein